VNAGVGPIGILGAMDAEVAEFLAHAEIHGRDDWNGFAFHRVRLQGREAVLVKCGVGKVFSALVSQHLIDTYAPSRLIFTGVAGSLNPAYDIGDVVVSRDCLQHDVDGSRSDSRGAICCTPSSRSLPPMPNWRVWPSPRRRSAIVSIPGASSRGINS
jgi:5'-methylthioadenosine/S-adenosylhomocysteine nucleosidase